MPGASPTALPLTVAFVDIAAALHAASGLPQFWSAQEFSSLLNMPGAGGLLAMTGDAPCGIILWRSAADEAEILTICTLPERRRQGIGRFLLESAAAILQKTSIRRVFLEVAIDNSAATGLYRTFGFQIAGYRRAYYKTADGMIDAHVFVKDL